MPQVTGFTFQLLVFLCPHCVTKHRELTTKRGEINRVGSTQIASISLLVNCRPMPKRFLRAEGSEGRPLNAVVLQSCSPTLQTGIEGLTALGRVETSTSSFNRFDDERIHKTSAATLHSNNHPACIPVANNAIDDIDDVEVELAKDNEMKRKRSIHDRPEEWKTIAEYYDQWGKNKTWEYFKELFGRSKSVV